MILFLDDDERRIRTFLRRTAGEGQVRAIARTAAECIATLKNDGPFEEVHLDHDLNGQTYCDSSHDDCGMEVVRWICLNNPDVRTFVVHTRNEIAGPLMVKALDAAGYRVLYIPFRYELHERNATT